MKIWILFVCVATLLAGCAKTKIAAAPTPTAAAATKPAKPIVTPDLKVSGRVAMFNAGARFVVLNFPIGGAPAADHKLNVYRNGLKVGEVKVTGPERDNNTVGDLIAGEAKVNDEVRED